MLGPEIDNEDPAFEKFKEMDKKMMSNKSQRPGRYEYDGCYPWRSLDCTVCCTLRSVKAFEFHFPAKVRNQNQWKLFIAATYSMQCMRADNAYELVTIIEHMFITST